MSTRSGWWWPIPSQLAWQPPHRAPTTSSICDSCQQPIRPGIRPLTCATPRQLLFPEVPSYPLSYHYLFHPILLRPHVIHVAYMFTPIVRWRKFAPISLLFFTEEYSLANIDWSASSLRSRLIDSPHHFEADIIISHCFQDQHA